MFQSSAKQRESCKKRSKLLDFKLYYRALLEKKKNPQKTKNETNKKKSNMVQRKIDM